MNELAQRVDRFVKASEKSSTLLIDARARLEAAQCQLIEWRAAQEILQRATQAVQKNIHAQIAAIVSKCLQLVFEEPYSFRIDFELKRGRTEAKLILEREGLELTDPLNEAGGGVIDVAAFALRVAVLLLSRTKSRPLIVMDEPFKFVHPPERRPRIVAMIEMLADKFNIQFIMITGIDELRCGTVIDLGAE